MGSRERWRKAGWLRAMTGIKWAIWDVGNNKRVQKSKAYSTWLIAEVAGFCLCVHITPLVVYQLWDHAFVVMCHNLWAIKSQRWGERGGSGGGPLHIQRVVIQTRICKSLWGKVHFPFRHFKWQPTKWLEQMLMSTFIFITHSNSLLDFQDSENAQKASESCTAFQHPLDTV